MQFVDPNTQASLPGQVSPSRTRYARYFAGSSWEALRLYSRSFAPFDPVRHARGIEPGILHWVQVQEHFRYGCLCPSVILDRRRGLVATYTDLDSGGGRPYPVVKLVREPLHLIPEDVRADGTRLASACLFYGTPESRVEGHWDDFVPILVDCLIDDRAACATARGRLSTFAWKALEIGAAQVDRGLVGRVQHVAIPPEIVSNAF